VLPTTSGRPNDTIAGAGTEGGREHLLRAAGVSSVPFGNTVWYRIFPHRPASCGWSPSRPASARVVAIMAVQPQHGLPDISHYACAVASLGTAILDYEFRLDEGAGYADPGRRTRRRPGLFALSVYFNPDTTATGWSDSLDSCPAAAGGSATHGCPDKDGDGVVDSFDRCPRRTAPRRTPAVRTATATGISTRRLCPARAPREARPQRQRCPDRELLKPETTSPRQLLHGEHLPRDPGEQLVVSEIRAARS